MWNNRLGILGVRALIVFVLALILWGNQVDGIFASVYIVYNMRAFV